MTVLNGKNAKIVEMKVIVLGRGVNALGIVRSLGEAGHRDPMPFIGSSLVHLRQACKKIWRFWW